MDEVTTVRVAKKILARCDTCGLWAVKSGGGTMGNCRRYAPRELIRVQGSGEEWAEFWTEDSYWCGEWRATDLQVTHEAGTV